MPIYYLSLGSNIEPEKNLPKCIEQLHALFDSVETSSLYETDPVGPAGSQKFWNAVAKIESPLGSDSLSLKIRELENSLGRKRDPTNKFIPRTIDIDLLPQKDYQKHGFIIIPLAEIAPNEKDEETGMTFCDLARELSEENKKGCLLIKQT